MVGQTKQKNGGNFASLLLGIDEESKVIATATSSRIWSQNIYKKLIYPQLGLSYSFG
jgi:hypothetical protein